MRRLASRFTKPQHDGLPADTTFRMVVGLLVVLAVAAVFRLVNLDHEPTPDELYHLLAAESWVESGNFAIGDGAYPRASAFTRLVGIVHGATDGDLNSIRLLCVFIGLLLIAAVYVPLRRLAGNREALVAALMLALMPGAIYLSQFIRFYGLHALMFWCAAILLYCVVSGSRSTRARLLLGVISAGLFVFALHLQKTTLIGFLGIGVWLSLLAVPTTWRWFSGRTHREKVMTVSMTVITIALLVLVSYNVVADLVDTLRSASLWSSETHAGYYAMRYRDQYGLFWSLFPIAVVWALLIQPRLALYSCCIFVVAFVLHSFAGMRSERYLFYAMPFFVTIWSIALIDGFIRLHRFLGERLRQIPITRSGDLASGRFATVLVSALIAWIVLMTPAVELSVRMMLDRPQYAPRYWFNFDSSWRASQDTIRELVDESDVFLTSQGHHAFYYIGDFDVELSATGLSDFQSLGEDNDVDPRTGRRVIADLGSLREIHQCHESGVVVVTRKSWRSFAGVNDKLADYMESEMSKVETPADWGMHIYRWSWGISGTEIRQRAGDCN